jgi:hypothetical protein
MRRVEAATACRLLGAGDWAAWEVQHEHDLAVGLV